MVDLLNPCKKLLLANSFDQHVNLPNYTENTSQVNRSATGNPAFMRFSKTPLNVAGQKSQS